MSRQYDAKQSVLKAHPKDRAAGVQLFLEILDISQADFMHEEGRSAEEYVYGAVREIAQSVVSVDQAAFDRTIDTELCGNAKPYRMVGGVLTKSEHFDSDGKRAEAWLKAAEITMGRGLVDVTIITDRGRSGILFRPREQYIPVGAPGQLQAGEYWPAEGDVVIWIENEGGASVIDKHLQAFMPATPFELSVGLEAILDDVWNAAVEQAAIIAKDCVHLTPDPDAAIRVMLNGRSKLHPASRSALSAAEVEG